MKSTGLVFKSRDYIGSAEPPATVLEDESRFGSNGVITTASWVQLPSGLWVLDFTLATPDYVEITPTPTQMNFKSEDFAVFLWAKFDANTPTMDLFIRGEDNVDGWGLRMYDGGYLQFFTAQAAATQNTYSSSGYIVAGLWRMIGAIRIGTSVKVYRDVADVTATSGTHTNPLTSARTAKIGVDDDKSSEAFDGQMALWKVFNYAPPIEQIAAIFQNERHWFGK